MEDKVSKEIKDKYNEEFGEIDYYGEFVSSYFNWTSPDELKRSVEKLENITKKGEK